MKRLILITGMHRSGTSATARLLNLLGVDFGTDLKNDQPQINARGFWEDRQALAIDEAVLADLHSVWYEHRELPDNWWLDPGLDRRRRQIQLLVQGHLSRSDMFGIKEPRLCLLLPLWLDALKSFNVEICVVLVTRDPRDVARSLRKRDGFDLATGLLLWLRYVLAGLRYSRPYPRAVIDYQRLLADPVAVAEQVAHDLVLDWPHPPAGGDTHLAAEIDPRLCHHRSQASDPPPSQRLAAHAVGIYRRLQHGPPAAYEICDDYMNWPECAHEGLAKTNKIVVDLNVDRHRIGRLHTHAMAVIDQRDETLDHVQKQLAALGASHAEALAAIQQRDRDVADLTQTIEAQKQDLTDLTAIYSELQNTLRQIQSHWSWGMRRRLLKYGGCNETR